MNEAVQLVLDQLQAAECQLQPDGQGWQACCPAHEDRNPSLSIGDGEGGKALLHCHAGCSFAEIVAALGLKPQDLMGPRSPGARRRPPNGNGRDQVLVGSGGGEPRRPPKEQEPRDDGPAVARTIVARYDYRDAAGRLVYQVVRFDPKDFRQRRPDPFQEGRWIWNLQGTGRILYRLPELIAAPLDVAVYVVEGEKDADSLAAVGLVATCAPQGAGKWARLDSDEALQDREVVILPDNDEQGRRHAAEVAASLFGRAAAVRVLQLPGLAVGGDVTDFLAANDPEDLDRLAALAPLWTPATTIVLARFPEGPAAADELRLLAKELRGRVAAIQASAVRLSKWVERGGLEQLGKDHPVAYAAAVCGMSPRHFHRLVEIGKVRRLLAGVACPPGEVPVDQLAEGTLRPLTRLLQGSADEIPAALIAARDQARGEYGKRGKPHATLVRRHVLQAVDDLVPRVLPAGDVVEPDPPYLAGWKLICRARDTLATVEGLPCEIRDRLRELQDLVGDLVLEERAAASEPAPCVSPPVGPSKTLFNGEAGDGRSGR